MRNYSYNRLILLGHCQSGRALFENLVTHTSIDVKNPDIIVDNALWNIDTVNKDFVHFLSAIVPEGKILLSRCNAPIYLNRLNNFHKWKFVQFDRTLIDTVASGMKTYHLDVHDTVLQANHQIKHLNIFWDVIKERAIRFEFKEVFHNLYKVIETIFKFLEMDIPDREMIDYYASKNVAFQYLYEHKCKIGEVADYTGLREAIIDKAKELKFLDYEIT